MPTELTDRIISKKHITLFVVVLTLAIAVLLLRSNQAVTPAYGELATIPSSNDRGYSATIELKINLKALGRFSVTSADITKALESYNKEHKTFHLSDVKDIRVKSQTGQFVPLGEIVDIDVLFVKQTCP